MRATGPDRPPSGATSVTTPASLSFRATVYYATDPGNQNADSITDVSPDGGMSPPVRRTSA